ncbi:hypothetical protein [Dickeya dadantii]|uniref:hypothetical protein n=1 Tax=Dickeya dadantii TaxID=204038 RepID=UPI00301837FD
MKKTRQQSRLGWGGRRKGAGAPPGNTNAVKHGERSRRAFFPLEGDDDLSPLLRNRVRNLLLAERFGQLLKANPEPGTEQWREMTLIHGLMGLHTDEIMRLELMQAKTGLKQVRHVKRDLRRIKKQDTENR